MRYVSEYELSKSDILCGYEPCFRCNGAGVEPCRACAGSGRGCNYCGAGKWRAFPVADAAVFTILIDQTRVPRTCLRQAGAPVCGGSDGYRNPVRGCSGGIKISSADAKCFQLGTDIVQGFGKQGRC